MRFYLQIKIRVCKQTQDGKIFNTIYEAILNAREVTAKNTIKKYTLY